jgi:dynein heavy chain
MLDLPPITRDGDCVYEYMVNPKTGEWDHWNTLVPEYQYPRNYTPPFASLFIPTVDNTRANFLIKTIAK